MLDALQATLEALPTELGLETFEGMVAAYERNLRAPPRIAAPRQRRGACAHAAPAARDSTNEHLAAYGHARVDFGWGARGFVPSKVLLYLYEGDHYGSSVKARRACGLLRLLLSHAAVRSPAAAPSGGGGPTATPPPPPPPPPRRRRRRRAQ